MLGDTRPQEAVCNPSSNLRPFVRILSAQSWTRISRLFLCRLGLAARDFYPGPWIARSKKCWAPLRTPWSHGLAAVGLGSPGRALCCTQPPCAPGDIWHHQTCRNPRQKPSSSWLCGLVESMFGMDCAGQGLYAGRHPVAHILCFRSCEDPEHSWTLILGLCRNHRNTKFSTYARMIAVLYHTSQLSIHWTGTGNNLPWASSKVTGWPNSTWRGLECPSRTLYFWRLENMIMVVSDWNSVQHLGRLC